MKKIICLILALVMVLSMVACTATPAEDTTKSKLDKIKEAGVLVLGTSADYPPYEFHTEIDGVDTIAGFDIDIAKYIAESLGVELKIVDMSFDNLFMSLNAGEFDMVVAACSADEEREKVCDFSDAYLPADLTLLVRAEDAELYKDLESLKGSKAGAQTGTVCYDYCVRYTGEETVTGLAKVQDIVLELINGKVDVAWFDYMTAVAYDAANDDLVMLDLTVPTDSMGYQVAVQEGEADFAAYINQCLKEINDNGLLEQYITAAMELSGGAE